MRAALLDLDGTLLDTARAAGCRVLLVPYGYTEGGAVNDLDCDGIVESLLHAARLPAIWT